MFGGYNENGQVIDSFEVLDLKSGIWRKFGDLGQHKLGHSFNQISHALPMPHKQIYLLSDGSTTIKTFSIQEMQCREVSSSRLPFAMERFSSVRLKRGVYLLCGQGKTA